MLDLRQGQAVHARRGQRERYAPLVSRLCASAEPLAVVAGLMAVRDWPVLYLADLDAIEGRGDHAALLSGIAHRWPALELWVDAGVLSSRHCRALARARPVIGSESLGQLPASSAALAEAGEGRALLSLDYREGRLLGPAGLEARPELWPHELLVMELDRVGAEGGPGLQRLAALRAQAPDRRFFAAGGVRGPEDLQRLAEAGCAGALVATALHQGRLHPKDLDAFT